MLHTVEHQKSLKSRSVVSAFVGMNDVWHVIIDQTSVEERLRCLGLPPSVQRKIQHCARFVDGLSAVKRRHRRCSGQEQPEFLASDLDVDLVQNPLGTPTGFPVAVFFGEEGCKLDVLLVQRFVAHLDATFLKVALAKGEAVIEPEGVLDNAQVESVAVKLVASHRGSAYSA